MAKKLLAIVAALTLLVCGVCVFSIAPASAASFDGDIAEYAPSKGDFVANDNYHYTTSGRIQYDDIEGGGVKLILDAANTASLGINWGKEVAMDGTHIVMQVKASQSNTINLVIGGTASDGNNDHPARTLVKFKAEGTLEITTKGNAITNSEVIKAMFAGSKTAIAFSVVDNEVYVTVSNEKGEDSGKFPGYGDGWTDRTKAYIAFCTQGEGGNHEVDILAFHDGSAECANKPAWWADVVEYGVAASDFVPNDAGHNTEGGRIQFKDNADGGVNLKLNAAGSASLGINWKNKVNMNGVHIVMRVNATDSNTFNLLLGGAVSDGNNDMKHTLTKFKADGTLEATTKGNVITNSEAIKAMFKGEITVISLSVKDNELYATVSNSAGTDTGKFPGYGGPAGNNWDNRAEGYITFCTQGENGNHEMDILALHDGSSECAFMGDSLTSLIAAIDAIGEVTLNSGAAIAAAEDAYAALSPDYKELVTNYATLTAARAAYDALVAAEVVAKIDAIGTVTENSNDAIKAAEAAYAALTAAQKALVTNYETLTTARKDFNDMTGITAADQAAAAAVDALIDAIGDVTLDSGDAIKAAEDAYAALTADQKAFVTKYDVLMGKRSLYDNMLVSKPVYDAINALPETITLADGDAVKAAKAAYAKLTADEKSFVENTAKLDAAVAAYEKLVYDTYVQQYESQILVKVGELSPYNTTVEAEQYESGKGVLIDSWAENGGNWAGRIPYAYAVGLDGLKIVLKGAQGIKAATSLGLMDNTNDWVDVPDSMIVFMLSPKETNECMDAPYGFLRAHRKFGSMAGAEDVWFARFTSDVWADDEIVFDFVMISDTVVAVFVDGQYMGDVTLEQLGVDNVEAIIPHFGMWDPNVQSYYVYSITSKNDATAIQNVVDLINAIGEVDVNDEECMARFEAAFNAYRALTKGQREYVSNYDVLEDALAKFEGGEVEDPTEEPVETEEPTEAPVETEEPTDNPKTGEGFAVLPIAMLIAAAGVVMISRKRK